jgi:hypothetical protein
MILDDFVMLGTTVPEPNSDGRIFVCSAGVSAELGRLVRIYPLARRGIPNRWKIYRVPLERNREDHRPESFKIRGDRSPSAHDHINEQFDLVGGKVPDADRAQLLQRFVVGSIAEANNKRLSLAVIHPSNTDLHFEHNPDSPDSPELRLFDICSEPPAGARRFPFIPRLRFEDDAGAHDLMLRDWGCYELQRKRGEAYFRENLAQALHLRESSSLLVGNMNNRRNSWLIISVLNGIRPDPTLFDALPSSRTAIPATVRRAIYERDDWKCVDCESRDDLTIDHRLPVVRGGTNEPDNLQTMCRPCNLKKSSSTNEAA